MHLGSSEIFQHQSSWGCFQNKRNETKYFLFGGSVLFQTTFSSKCYENQSKKSGRSVAEKNKTNGWRKNYTANNRSNWQPKLYSWLNNLHYTATPHTGKEGTSTQFLFCHEKQIWTIIFWSLQWPYWPISLKYIWRIILPQNKDKKFKNLSS